MADKNISTRTNNVFLEITIQCSLPTVKGSTSLFHSSLVKGCTRSKLLILCFKFVVHKKTRLQCCGINKKTNKKVHLMAAYARGVGVKYKTSVTRSPFQYLAFLFLCASDAGLFLGIIGRIFLESTASEERKNLYYH